MKILLTGFEPFNESPINPSEQVVKAITSKEIEGVEITGVTLPVDTDTAPPKLTDYLAAADYHAVICLGEARGRTAISFERIGINLMDFRIPDNSGNTITDQPVIAGGPDAYFCTLPVRRMMEAVQEAGIPAELSLSAGAYLCNQVTYHLLHNLAESLNEIPAGFIHLPPLPQQITDKPKTPSMSLETMVEGITIAIKTLIENSGA